MTPTHDRPLDTAPRPSSDRRRRLLASATGAFALVALAGSTLAGTAFAETSPAAPPASADAATAPLTDVTPERLADVTAAGDLDEVVATMSSSVRLVPRSLDLGTIPAGTEGHGELLVVNEGPSTIVIDGVKAGCGCTRVNGFAAFELAPGEARVLEVEMDAPGAGEGGRDLNARKDVRLQVLSSGRPYATAMIRARRGSAADEPRLVAAARPDEAVMRGTIHETAVWLALPATATGPIEIAGAKASCGCTTMADLAGTVIARGTVIAIPLAIDTADADPGEKRVTLRVVLSDGHRLEQTVAIEVEPGRETVRIAPVTQVISGGGC